MESFAHPIAAIRRWLPTLPRDVWILAAGQFLLFMGQGFTLVYAALYFVNTLGFSPTEVGLAQGSMGISGTLGRFWSGNSNVGRLGRKGTLVVAAAIAGMGSLVLAQAETFPLLVAGNLLLGLGIGLYWPANLALTTDITPSEHRSEAMALNRLSDNLGSGLGVLIAGQYMARFGSYTTLFIAKGVLCFAFAAVIAAAIAEPPRDQDSATETWQRWGQALGDRRLLTLLGASIFVTTFTAQISTTFPLYLANFVPGGNTATGFSDAVISYFFGWHALLKIVLQLPLARWFRNTSPVSVMMGSVGLWAAGLVLLWSGGRLPAGALFLVLLAFGVIALGEILFSPFASTLIGDLAPANSRSIYFALESEIWAIGFVIGPILGGWALDHPETLGTNLWLVLAASATIAIGLLLKLRHQIAAAPDPA